MKAQIDTIKEFLDQKLSRTLDLVVYIDKDQEHSHKFNQIIFIYEMVIQRKENLPTTPSLFEPYLRLIR